MDKIKEKYFDAIVKNIDLHPVRLIEIDTSRDETTLKVVDVTHDIPPYIAISHTWSSNDEDTEPSSLENFSIMTNDAKIGDYTVQVNQTMARMDQNQVVQGLKSIAQQVLNLGNYRKKNGALSDETLWIESVNYFWVDAICLDQQDEKDKDRDLFEMNSIYSNARAVICVMQPISETATPFLENFRWFYRVWTYQELNLNSENWFLDRNVTHEKWREILDEKVRKEKGHCKTKSPEDIEVHLKDYLDHISVGFIKNDSLPLIEYYTYRKTILPYIEDKNHPISSLPELNYGLTDNRSLAKLMFYTRHRQSKHPEDRIIGLLGLLNTKIDAKGLYKKGMIVTLNSILKGMFQNNRSKHELGFIICRWYCESSSNVAIIDRYISSDDSSYTGLLTCEFTYDDRDMEVLEFEKDRVNIRGEVLSGMYLGHTYDGDIYSPEPYEIHLEFHRKFIGTGKIDRLLRESLRINVFLIRVINCVDYFYDDKSTEIWLICSFKNNVYHKKGIILVKPGLLYGVRQDIYIL